jgi:FkbM family methyltransferase
LRYRIPSGGVLLLERGHSFTGCFWPGVDQYEPDVRAALLYFLKPGNVFLDCGANIGYFSVLAGPRVAPDGQVIAIEANPVTRALLERNLKLNGFGRVMGCALTDMPGELDLFMPLAGDVYSSVRVGGLVAGPDIRRFRALGQTLDMVVAALELQRVDVVKLDIEGAELSVLRSAKRVMTEFRPLIICEYGSNTWPTFEANKEDLASLLEKRDYHIGIFDPSTQRIKAVDEEVWNSAYVNLVLVPNDRSGMC